MKKPSRHDPAAERTVAPFPGRLERLRGRVDRFHLRDAWWQILDFFEAHRFARLGLYLAAFGVVAGLVTWHWAYPWWNRRNAVRIAQSWLESGHLNYAAEAAQRAAALAPDDPEPWLIAAELARRGGQYSQAYGYSVRAAELDPEDTAIAITVAADALRADQPEKCVRHLDRLPPAIQENSADVQRMRGELARRALRLTEARAHFEAAARIEGPRAENEVPLGLITLNATDQATRRQGLDLLTRWSGDTGWGATALRALLNDALGRDESAPVRGWADALLQHPRRTNDDMRLALLALSRTDPARFAEVLAGLQRDHGTSPAGAAQLISWLNQIGRSGEALRWMNTLPAHALLRPPLIVSMAETLRLQEDWTGLRDWTAGGTWNQETDFLRWSYALQAAHELGDRARAEELQRTLLGRAELNGTHGLFAAGLLYGWGRTEVAEALWWRLTEQQNEIAVEALGALARHYQVRRDAEGQYRVFRRLQALRPMDSAIGNNLAFFASLTGRDQRLAARLARENLDHEPLNRAFIATQAFVWLQEGRTTEALNLLRPRASEADSNPALGYVYTLALAMEGRIEAARRLRATVPPDTMTSAEEALLDRHLGG